MKGTTRSRLILESALAVGLPIALSTVIHTDAFEELIALAVRSAPVAWLSLLVGCVLIVYQLKLFASLYQFLTAKGDVARVNALRSDPGRIRRVRRREFAAATVCLSFLVCFLLLEIIFRVCGVVPAEGKFPTYDPRMTVNNSLNRMGLREPWETIPASDTRKRIAFLGDSFVYGYGVEREEAFVSLVEVMLSDTVTINIGNIGSNPKEQYAVYLQLRDQIKPDVLVHVIYMNDLDFDLFNLLRTIHYIPKRDSWLAGQSYVVRYVEKQIQFRRQYAKSLKYFSGGETSQQRAASWADFETYVTLCRDAAQVRGAEYRMVIFPWLYKLDDYPLVDVHNRMVRFAERLGVPCLDLLGTFEGMDDDELRINEVDSHPNATGHRIAAEAISQWLQE